MHIKPRFLLYAFGIFATYFYYGIVQEKITKGSYNNETFNCILSLVFLQTVANFCFAKIVSVAVLNNKEDSTNVWYYIVSALTYLLAMLCSNVSLKWVSYPTQVIAKSGKPIPVMVLGVLLGKKSYPFRKYIFVLLIVIGVAIFMYQDRTSTSSSVFGVGEILLMLSLAMDGIAGAVQERMRIESKTKSVPMMINMNKWSILFLTIAIYQTGEIYKFINFVNRNPQIISDLILFSVCSAFGQFFIFKTVSEYGPLPCSIVTTTRKFFTILGSVLFFGNVIQFRQWIAAIVVFTGLFLDSVYGKQSNKIQGKKVVKKKKI